MGHSADFFLGASGPNGFRSYFERSFSAADGWRVLILKGGPGTGKSTLMKRICSAAEDRELYYERIWCSSDPSSLDAVIVPSLRRAIFDGTPPHTLEPAFPGVCESIVDLGTEWDAGMLERRREEIMTLSAECSRHHAQCARFLACADAFRQNTVLLARRGLNTDKIERMAARMVSRILKSSVGEKKKPSESVRLLSAVTPNGVCFAGKPQWQTIRIDDSTGVAAHALLASVRKKLLAVGETIVVCPCSQNAERLEHLIIPDHDVMITTCNDAHSIEGSSRLIHAERFCDANPPEVQKRQFSLNRRAQRELTQLAAEELRSALEVHDRLEQCYREAMDFAAVDRTAEKAAERFFAE